MAPEQARGEAIDHRADLFSLGSTLYAMCTGRPPFRAETAMAVLRRVSDEEPTPIREVNPDVPKWLAGIIERLHAKDPNRRFQTSAEVADLLGKCLAHVERPDDAPLPAAARSSDCALGRAGAIVRWFLVAAAACAFAAVGVAGGQRAASLWRAAGSNGDPHVGEDAGAGKHTSSVAARSLDYEDPVDLDRELHGWRQYATDLEHHMKSRSPERPDPLWGSSVSEIWKHLERLEQDVGRPSR
jgi:hypothetical protein